MGVSSRWQMWAMALLVLLPAIVPPAPAAAQEGRGCSFFSQCPNGFSCHPVVQRCYHSPRRAGQPCMAGYGCGPGLQCEAGTQVCKGPGQEGEGCHLTRPCASGLTCEAGSQRCRAPGREGESCHATRPCDDGLTCEAGSHVCRAPGAAGQTCHATRPCGDGLTCEAGTHVCRTPGQINQACHATRPCAAGLYCQPVIHKCAPGELDLTSAQLCSGLRVQELADAARGANVTMTYGAGGQSSAGASVSVETGVAYGNGGEFGCYATVCGGIQLDASINAYMALGIARSFADVSGVSFVTSQGVSTPFIQIGPGFTTAQVMDTRGSLTGTTNAVSFGIGVSPVPFQVGAMTCCTAVIDGTSGRLMDLATGVQACGQQLAAMGVQNGGGGGGGGVQPPPPPPPPPPPAAALQLRNRYRSEALLILEPVSDTEYYYARPAGGDGYLHTERGPLELGPIERGWWSAMWLMTPDGTGFQRLRNRYRGEIFLHTEQGPIQGGAIEPGWWSAMWGIIGNAALPRPQPLASVASGPMCAPPSARAVAEVCRDGRCATPSAERSGVRRLLGWLAGWGPRSSG